ncbi:hypothetical protein M409DRAFT_69900 [Zasmidium cellare ATCC 36951]|uniref:Histone-lysine N-methyltransferase, H3 lysine-79 specific n=1 Tax=Zasmidium cellare ATCC 36951 TaxID=1080233 RepID=A0A6A6C5Y9_ZASCE|nr:uncharacterized protein M409DRAFT_69900 [Zasmidium cellare ATCC 36951]KAF2161302.1 hypothetical protein M409DRAFT_69900 [Zasmidium cellare ATCC 36951]
MNFSKPKTGANQPVIRKTIVRKVVTPNQSTAGAQRPSGRPDPNRFNQALHRASPKPATSKKPPNPARRALSVSRGVKRKSATPQPALFSSDDEDDSSDIGGSDSDASRKRIKSSVSSVESSGPRRNVISEAAFKDDTIFDFIHGADATSGPNASKFKNPFEDEVFECVELQYPSKGHKERFELKWPKYVSKDDYKPMEDIIETIKTICTWYFPEELVATGLSEETGYDRRFHRAWQRESVDDFIEIVQDFNTILGGLLSDGTLEKELKHKRSLHLDWVRRILDQTYGRTVSPKVETLRAYQNGSDNVYGELMPRLCSEMFHKTKLNHEQVFVDLGSGVGNVVLQAALEIGCESWGIEMMKNPCDLAELQAREFPARARLWGLSAGKVNLLRGDFTDHPGIDEVLRRADVVLVNNQAFTPALNDKLCNKFLDLKEGCQVVSLKPFVPEGHKLAMRNIHSVANQLVQRRFEYFSNSVSWTDVGGHYYIATKDRRPMDAFLKSHGLQ